MTADKPVLAPRHVVKLFRQFCDQYPESVLAVAADGWKTKNVFRLGSQSVDFQTKVIDEIVASPGSDKAMAIMAVWIQVWHVNMRQTRVTRNSVRSALLVLSTRAGEDRRHAVEVATLEYLIAHAP